MVHQITEDINEMRVETREQFSERQQPNSQRLDEAAPWKAVLGE